METITRQELQRLLDEGAVTLVEALPRVQYDAGHLPDALNLPGTTRLGGGRRPPWHPTAPALW